MKRPAWATVIGVLGIVFGCFGILRAGQTMLLPWILAFQKDLFEAIATNVGSSQQGAALGEGMLRILQMVWGSVPSWFGAWSVSVGAAAMLVSGFSLYASIALLLMRPAADRMIIWAFGASIALNLVKGVVFGATFSILGLVLAVGAAFSIVVNGVFLLVVLTSDRSAFQPGETTPAGGRG